MNSLKYNSFSSNLYREDGKERIKQFKCYIYAYRTMHHCDKEVKIANNEF